MIYIALLLILLVFGGIYWIWDRLYPKETNTFTHLPKITVKESEYIKQKRQKCIERFSDKLITTNPNRKVDLLNPTVLK